MAVKEFIPPDSPPKKYVSPGLKPVRLRLSDVEKATDKLLNQLYNLGFDEQIKFELEQTSATFSDQPISIDDLKYTLHQFIAVISSVMMGAEEELPASRPPKNN